MKIEQQIQNYIAEQSEPKRSEMLELHQRILKSLPDCKLWFLDGKNEENKVVTNPNIGYGVHMIKYADGKTKEFYQIGMSANTTGISIYIMTFSDKKYLSATYGSKMGKASITGYCIKFKSLKDIDITTLLAAIKDGSEQAA